MLWGLGLNFLFLFSKFKPLCSYCPPSFSLWSGLLHCTPAWFCLPMSKIGFTWEHGPPSFFRVTLSCAIQSWFSISDSCGRGEEQIHSQAWRQTQISNWNIIWTRVCQQRGICEVQIYGVSACKVFFFKSCSLTNLQRKMADIPSGLHVWIPRRWEWAPTHPTPSYPLMPNDPLCLTTPLPVTPFKAFCMVWLENEPLCNDQPPHRRMPFWTELCVQPNPWVETDPLCRESKDRYYGSLDRGSQSKETKSQRFFCLHCTPEMAEKGIFNFLTIWFFAYSL